jgi:hypothetical protein
LLTRRDVHKASVAGRDDLIDTNGDDEVDRDGDGTFTFGDDGDEPVNGDSLVLLPQYASDPPRSTSSMEIVNAAERTSYRTATQWLTASRTVSADLDYEESVKVCENHQANAWDTVKRFHWFVRTVSGMHIAINPVLPLICDMFFVDREQ